MKSPHYRICLMFGNNMSPQIVLKLKIDKNSEDKFVCFLQVLMCLLIPLSIITFQYKETK